MQKKMIVVADDEGPIRFAAHRILQVAGYDVLEASNGIETLDILKARVDAGKPVDLILLDFLMPGCSGKEVIQSITKHGWPLRIMMMTGTFDGTHLNAIKGYEHVDILCKPFTRDKLLEEVTRALAE